jgi:amidophosphoribosyltransferase
LGLVTDIFSPNDIEQLPGTAAVGHTRYSTAGGVCACAHAGRA